MKMTTKYVLFTDLDETLLKSDKTISEETFLFFKEFSEKGNIIVLNSGRDKNSVYSVYEYLNFNRLKNVYIIGYDGGQIYDCDNEKTLFKITIPFDTVRYLEKKAKEYGIHLHAYSETHIISPDDSPELEFYRQTIKTPVIISPEITDAMDEGPCKCLTVELPCVSKTEKFKEDLTPWAKEAGITFLYSSDKLMEIFPSVSGKGRSLRILADMLKEKEPETEFITIGAGDQHNDLSMLKEADISIGMMNGIDEIKENASYVTEYDNNHDGLILMLKRICSEQ